jgi:predicted transcriptional regulator
MQDQTKHVLDDDARRLERAIVAHILSDDHDPRWSRAELTDALEEAEPRAVIDALTRLGEAGVVGLEDDSVQASRATARLEELELIAV